MQPGTQLGHYQILGTLGRGGMGEVWRARDTKLGREVAIKTLPEEFAGDGDRLVRFGREAKVLASLSHANIADSDGGDPGFGIVRDPRKFGRAIAQYKTTRPPGLERRQ